VQYIKLVFCQLLFNHVKPHLNQYGYHLMKHYHVIITYRLCFVDAQLHMKFNCRLIVFIYYDLEFVTGLTDKVISSAMH